MRPSRLVACSATGHVPARGNLVQCSFTGQSQVRLEDIAGVQLHAARVEFVQPLSRTSDDPDKSLRSPFNEIFDFQGGALQHSDVQGLAGELLSIDGARSMRMCQVTRCLTSLLSCDAAGHNAITVVVDSLW